MRDAPREPRELPSQMRSKAPHTIFFFQLKHAGNSTQLANLAGRCRRQTSSEAISIQKGPRTEGPDIRFIASSARKEGHLMWPSSCAGLSEQQTKTISSARRPPLSKIFKKVVDVRVTTRLIYPLRDGPVAQLVRASG